MMYGLVLVLAGLLTTSLAANAALVFRHAWTRPSRTRTICSKITLSIATLFYSLLAMETYFTYCFAQSDAWGGLTMSSRTWFQKYWKPINSLGYRDIEHTPAELVDKQVLFVLGDSLAAGHGIDSATDRFPDIIRDRLDDNWTVVNIAQCGWNTVNEFDALVAYPHKPNAVILSYVLNDIFNAANHRGMPSLSSPKAPRKLKPILDRSGLANFIYWRYRRSTGRNDFLRYLQACYSNEEIWQDHTRELSTIIDYCKEIDAELTVVIFPFMFNVQETGELTARVASFFKQRGVQTIDLALVLKDRKPRELVVNAVDGHPNEEVHAQVADLCLKQLLANNRGVGTASHWTLSPKDRFHTDDTHPSRY